MSSTTSSSISHSDLVKLYRQAVVSGVPMADVDRKITRLMARQQVAERVEQQDDQVVITKLKQQIPWYMRLGAMAVPVVLIVVGVWLVGNAAIPIVNAYLAGAESRQRTAMVAPVPASDLLEVNPVVIGLAQAQETVEPRRGVIEPVILDNELDYTNLSNWFGGNTSAVAGLTQAQTASASAEQSYTLDIPSLKISNAVVKIGGADLNSSLIHYPGTANPGEFGAPVIFGHSVLRQFYNPSEKNPRRYTSIFSTIMTMKKGEEIYVTYEGVKYTYVVEEKLEVKPEDTYILNQQYDNSLLKLVTCTPEGTYLRRGIVVARLKQN